MFSPRFIFLYFGLIQKHRRNRFLLREASRTSDWVSPARSGFTTFCHRKVAPKVSAGHLRRDRTKAVTERSRKTPLVARSLRAFPPLSDPFPPLVQCGDSCALRATMIYSLSKLFRIFDCAEATFARQCPNKFDIALTYSYLCMI